MMNRIRIFAVLAAIAIIISSLASTVYADSATADSVSGSTITTQRHTDKKTPQNDQSSSASDAGAQDSSSSDHAQLPNSDTQPSQPGYGSTRERLPQQGRGGFTARTENHNSSRLPGRKGKAASDSATIQYQSYTFLFDQLLKDGVINQDTYDRIQSYLKQRDTAPAKPETDEIQPGSANTSLTTSTAVPGIGQLLEDMVHANILTGTEYRVLLSSFTDTAT